MRLYNVWVEQILNVTSSSPASRDSYRSVIDIKPDRYVRDEVSKRRLGSGHGLLEAY